MAGKKQDLNSEALKEQNETVRTMHFLDLLQGVDEKIAVLAAERKAIKKKAGIFGIIGKDLEFGLKAMDFEDHQVPVDEYRRHGNILQMLGYMPQFQPALMLDRTPADERIAAEGRRQGLLGRARETGYAKGSQEEQWWLTGYDNGNKLRMERLADALDESKLDPTGAAGKRSLEKKAAEAKKNPAAPLGDLPPEAEKPAEAEAKPTRKKPPKPGDENGGRTNAEIEAERQARASFN